MAFDFGAALTSLGQTGPAIANAQEIQRQRFNDQAAAQQRAQAAQDISAQTQAQTQREQALATISERQANRPQIISDKPFLGEDGKSYVLTQTPEGQIQRQEITGGFDPLATQKHLISTLGIDPNSNLARYIMLGGKAIPQGYDKIQAPDGTIQYIPKPGTGLSMFDNINKGQFPTEDGQPPISGAAPSTSSAPGSIPFAAAGGNPNAPTTGTPPTGTAAGSGLPPAIAQIPGVINTGVKAKMPIYAQGKETNSSYTDPLTGLTINRHTVTTPLGAQGRAPGTTTPPSASPTAPPAARLASPSVTPSGASQSLTSTPAAKTALTQAGLDSDGHIPARPGINDNVREAANRLLDGAPASNDKVGRLAQTLAGHYGWQQGTFTPKENIMLTEATTFLKKGYTDPSLSVLDSDLSRTKLISALGNPDKNGFIGRLIQGKIVTQLTPQEIAYKNLYNQMVGTISGLSQLIRSGRASEATIERLKNELPNPATTANSADARDKIARILQEVAVAKQKNGFPDVGGGRTGTSNPPNQTITVTAEDMKNAR